MAITITQTNEGENDTLFQWDRGRTITLSGFSGANVVAVDFVLVDAGGSAGLAHRVDKTVSKDSDTVEIPEAVLQKAGHLEVYVMAGTVNESGADKVYCVEHKTFRIAPRSNTVEDVLMDGEVLETAEIIQDWDTVSQLQSFHYKGMTPGIIVAANGSAAMYDRGKFLEWEDGDVLLDIENKHLYVYSSSVNSQGKTVHPKWLDLGILWYVDANSNLVYWDGKGWRVTKFFYNLSDLEDLANGSFRYTGTVYGLNKAAIVEINKQLSLASTYRENDSLQTRFDEYMTDDEHPEAYEDPSKYVGQYTAVEWQNDKEKGKYVQKMDAYVFGRMPTYKFRQYEAEAKSVSATEQFNEKFPIHRVDPYHTQWTYFFEDVLSISEVIYDEMKRIADDYPQKDSNYWVESNGIYEEVNRNLSYQASITDEPSGSGNLHKLWYKDQKYKTVVHNGGSYATVELLTMPYNYNFMAKPSATINNSSETTVPSVKAVYNNVNRTLTYKGSTVSTTKNDLWYLTESNINEYKAKVENGGNTIDAILLKGIGYDFMAAPSTVLQKDVATKVPSLKAVYANVNRTLTYKTAGSAKNDLWYSSNSYKAKVENGNTTEDVTLLNSVGYDFMAVPSTSITDRSKVKVPSNEAVDNAIDAAANRKLTYKGGTKPSSVTVNDLWYTTAGYTANVNNQAAAADMVLLAGIGYDFMAKPLVTIPDSVGDADQNTVSSTYAIRKAIMVCLESAQQYASTKVAEEAKARKAAVTQCLTDAKAYTDTKIKAEETARDAAITKKASELTTAYQNYVNSAISTSETKLTTAYQSYVQAQDTALEKKLTTAYQEYAQAQDSTLKAALEAAYKAYADTKDAELKTTIETAYQNYFNEKSSDLEDRLTDYVDEVTSGLSEGGNITYSPDNPQMDGQANAGSATSVARSDHVHPTDTGRAPAIHTHAATDIASGILSVERGGTGNSTTDTIPTSLSTKMVTSGGLFTFLQKVLAASVNYLDVGGVPIDAFGFGTPNEQPFSYNKELFPTGMYFDITGGKTYKYDTSSQSWNEHSDEMLISFGDIYHDFVKEDNIIYTGFITLLELLIKRDILLYVGQMTWQDYVDSKYIENAHPSAHYIFYSNNTSAQGPGGTGKVLGYIGDSADEGYHGFIPIIPSPNNLENPLKNVSPNATLPKYA